MNDRELDALVAEKVMGWTYWRSKHDHWIVTTPRGETMEPLFGQVRRFDSYTGEKLPAPLWHEGVDLPAYSTTGDGMLAVIEKMRERGYSVGFQWSVFGEPHAVVSQEPEGPVAYLGPVAVFKASARSLPRAVSLAALKALGVEVPA